jgi:hypothetical protein
MHRLVRSPLTWMIAAEAAVVAALVLVAWHALASAASSGVSVPFALPPSAAAPADNALPAAGVPVVGAPDRGPAPGLNVGTLFWRVRLGSLNRDEAAFEALEWRITHAVMESAHQYLETVVIPAVRRAEGRAA